MKGEDNPPVLTSMCLVQRTVSSGVQAGSQSTQPLLATHENCKCCEITEHEHVVCRVTKSSLCFI